MFSKIILNTGTSVLRSMRRNVQEFDPDLRLNGLDRKNVDHMQISYAHEASDTVIAGLQGIWSTAARLCI